MTSLIEQNELEVKFIDKQCLKTQKLHAFYQLQKEGFPAGVAAELTGLKESEVTKPEVRS